jgi:hypothetical protein
MLIESNDPATVMPAPRTTPLTETEAAERLGLKVATLRARGGTRTEDQPSSAWAARFGT